MYGYSYLEYIDPNSGWAHDFFPALGYVSVLGSAAFPPKNTPGYHSPRTVYVTESIVPYADPALFAPGPGMQAVPMSKLWHDRIVSSLVNGKGVSAADAEVAAARETEAVAAGLAAVDANWKKSHPEAK